MATLSVKSIKTAVDFPTAPPEGLELFNGIEDPENLRYAQRKGGKIETVEHHDKGHGRIGKGGPGKILLSFVALPPSPDDYGATSRALM